jgi:hypothetical protein
MSNVIRFLESVGGTPVTAADYAASVAALNVEDSERQALLGRDSDALSDLLGGRLKMYCSVVAPNEEDMPDLPDDEPAESNGPPNEHHT